MCNLSLHDLSPCDLNLSDSHPRPQAGLVLLRSPAGSTRSVTSNYDLKYKSGRDDRARFC
jgi:hypothetical protein